MKRKLKSGKFTSDNRKMLEKAIGRLKAKVLNLPGKRFSYLARAKKSVRGK